MNRVFSRKRPSLISHFLHTVRIAVFRRRFVTSVFALSLLAAAMITSETPRAVQASTPGVRPTATEAPAVHTATGEHGAEISVEISVLTYNVKGLPWLLRLDLAEPDPETAMTKIATHLATLRAQGRAPDIVLIQEGFPNAAAHIGGLAQYRYAVHGPTRADADSVAITPAVAALAAEADWTRGEAQGPLLDSGLHAFSNFPMTLRARRAFGRHACAGFDCLAAKGVLMFTVDIPGLPDPVSILTVHMNANGAAGVAEPRALAAHRLQIDSLADTLASATDPAWPLIFGGDFNVKAARARQQYADERLGQARLVSVHTACRLPTCAPGYRARDTAHWLEPRDIQGFRNGARVRLQPVTSEEIFAGPENGGQMSDHIGYLVRYRLLWSAP